MPIPENPYKHIKGDGVHIEQGVIVNPGEIPQRVPGNKIEAVPAGTEGQVPTYGADGTLAPGDLPAGGATNDAFVHAIDTQSLSDANGQVAINVTPVNGYPTATDPSFASLGVAYYDEDVQAVVFNEEGLYHVSVLLLVTPGEGGTLDGTLNVQVNGYGDWAPSSGNQTFDVAALPKRDSTSAWLRLETTLPVKATESSPNLGFDLAYSVSGVTTGDLSVGGQLAIYKLS